MASVKVLILITLICSTLSMNIFAKTGKYGKDSKIELVQKSISKNAAEVGLSTDDYLYAAHRFERLVDTINDGQVDLEEHDIDFLSDIPSVNFAIRFPRTSSYEVLRDMRSDINQNKTKLANFLSIDVTLVDIFVQHYGTLRYLTLQEDVDVDVYAQQSIERIRVVCADSCARLVGYPNMPLGIALYVIAQDSGIQQYERFTVEFRDQNTNQTRSISDWRYNNFSGAWKLTERPCDICELH